MLHRLGGARKMNQLLLCRGFPVLLKIECFKAGKDYREESRAIWMALKGLDAALVRMLGGLSDWLATGGARHSQSHTHASVY